MVLTLGLLGLASAMASTIVGQRLSASRSELTVTAEAKLDELRGIANTVATNPLRAQLAVGGSITANVAGYRDSIQTADNRWYHRRWAIANGVAGTRRVTIRVRPASRQRSELAFETYTTLLALR